MRLTLIALAALAMISLASAQQQTETGTGLLCDTAEQVRLVMALIDRGTDDAIRQVNAETNSSACGVFSVAYVLVGEAGAVKHNGETYAIAEIAVIGVMTPQGMRPAAPPLRQFTILKKPGQEI